MSFLTGLFRVLLPASAAVWALLATGCRSDARPNRASTTVLAATVPEPMTVATPAPLTPAPTEAPSPLAIVEPTAPVEKTNVLELSPVPFGPSSPAGSAWPKEWVNVWLPLESWGRFNGLGRPNQLSTGTEAVFRLTSSNGAVLVKMGSHMANLGGLEYGLGFAPRLIRGLPYIHSLDAQKTLQAVVGALLRAPVKNRTIVIDPGHGGRDSGTKSSSAPDYEKNYTLDWALRLQRCLGDSDCKVILTRTNDADLSLAERVLIADRANADLFISLHLNSGGLNHELCGVETYCLTPTGMPSNLLRGSPDDPHETHLNNQFDEQNVQLASRLHRAVLQTTGALDRGVRHARFMAVLRGQNRPAALIEGGYLSNPAEAHKLASPDYRQALAEGVAKALLE